MSHLPIVNRTVVRKSGLIPLFDVLFALEIVLTTTGFFLVLLAVKYRARSQFHINFRCIVTNYGLHFVLLAWTRLVMITLTMDWDGNGTWNLFISAWRLAGPCHRAVETPGV